MIAGLRDILEQRQFTQHTAPTSPDFSNFVPSQTATMQEIFADIPFPNIAYRSSRRPYRYRKNWCPPPPDPAFVVQPMPERRWVSRPRGVAWLTRCARTPKRERRAVRRRVEKKDSRHDAGP